MKILHLTLKKKWFDMIASGEKTEEYRHPSKWIMSRIEGKEYDIVQFTNGYGADKPVARLEYNGWDWGYGCREWGGGSTPGNPLVVIKLGKILSIENYN